MSTELRVPSTVKLVICWEMMARHYKDLIVWQKAMHLVNAVYDATDAFPKRETYSLTDQIRRAAVSIPSNIAEGKHTTVIVSFFIFFGTLAVLLPNLRPNYSSHKGETICLNPKRELSLNKPKK